jgi:polysaccharide deacetylase 2 family uncharacterized protein YibQ
LLGLGCLVAATLWLLRPDTSPVAEAPRAEVSAPATATPVATEAATPSPEPTPTPTLVPTATPTPVAQRAALSEPSEAPEVTASSPPEVRVGTGRPRLAIIIDDCGQWPRTEHGFVELPFPVTLSVLPHVRYGPEIAKQAASAGKGVMLHLPMQTISGMYPGPGTITVSMPDAMIQSEVASDLAELPEARGVNNHEGSRATADRRVMSDVADVLARENRFWIDSRTSAASVAASVTRERGVPTASRDVFLDDVDREAAVIGQLHEAAARARANGSAIAIGHPRPATLAAVKLLAPQLMANGIDLTLASDLVH